MVITFVLNYIGPHFFLICCILAYVPELLKVNPNLFLLPKHCVLLKDVERVDVTFATEKSGVPNHFTLLGIQNMNCVKMQHTEFRVTRTRE